mmetsp:Transcript_10846/g.14174  ORF Transcript_10846/g.14174 Transcript_10846/m.14174 type:complete len:362 (+) Transcript_10846:125-1210(+)
MEDPVRRCTCSSPPPIIEIEIEIGETCRNSDDRATRSSSMRTRMRNACESHGCFYIQKSIAIEASEEEDVEEEEGGDWFAIHDWTHWEDMFEQASSLELKSQSIYRGRDAESGSSSAAEAEPKQSLEWQRKWGNDEVKSDVDKFMCQWTNFMHEAAKDVRDCLGLSADLMAHDEEQQTSIDLLRMFRYDAVSQDRTLSLGSSAHTDWGALTIVYQDLVGGLQRYCPVHETWIDVHPVPNRVGYVTMFVHVGDFLSISSGGRWLSPRHRVVSPIHKTRFSNVYFVYPKPGISFEFAKSEFLSLLGSQTNLLTSEKSYSFYSLLQNQAKVSNEGLSSSTRLFESFRSKGFETLIEEKWMQVQR